MSEIVDTFEKARILSLEKWEKLQELSVEIFNEIDTKCGFCELGIFRVEEKGDPNAITFIKKCDFCQVEDRCDIILEETSVLNASFDKFIGDILLFLRDLKELKAEKQ